MSTVAVPDINAPRPNTCDHYRVGEVARRLDMGERTIWRLITTGELSPVVRIGRRLVLVPDSTVASFLERHTPAA